MSLFQKAYETYTNHEHLVGVIREGHEVFTPISHIIQKAQIEITINQEGDFISASEVPATDCRTIIPATEASAGRTSKAVAHPLCDQLKYIAPEDAEKHALYINGLQCWADSEQSHPKVRAVCAYVKKGSIVEDLARTGIIKCNDDGTMAKGKVAGKEYLECLVRWCVLGTGEKSRCWEDISLFRSFIVYYDGLMEKGQNPVDLCMVSGNTAVTTPNHPKGIVSAAYGAKLISANDAVNFTYRGRFRCPEEAATVSYTASQKAHCALQWIVADQGMVIGGRTFVCWNPKGKAEVKSLLPFAPKKSAATLGITPTQYREKLSDTLLGYKNGLPDTEDIVIAAFDAATTGRLSLTYYSEQRASDFLRRVQTWYETCCWPNGQYGIQSPPLTSIVECAFGTERETFLEVDEKVKKEQVQRLLTCVTEEACIPYDVVKALVHRASVPLAYKEKRNRNKVLFTACAMMRKYYNDQAGKEKWTMELDAEREDRSYLFGRLLAVMEKVERDTYGAEEEREPNAIRMQSVFCERPMNAARIIHEQLAPYFARLSSGSRGYYKKLIGEIMEKLAMVEEKELNRPLGDTYLMGKGYRRKQTG